MSVLLALLAHRASSAWMNSSYGFWPVNVTRHNGPLRGGCSSKMEQCCGTIKKKVGVAASVSRISGEGEDKEDCKLPASSSSVHPLSIFCCFHSPNCWLVGWSVSRKMGWLAVRPPGLCPLPLPLSPVIGAVQFDVGWYAMEGFVQVDTVLGVAFQDPQTALQQLEVPLHTHKHTLYILTS